MQAFEDGKEVWFSRTSDKQFSNVLKKDPTPVWVWANITYFLKPKESVVDWTRIPADTPVLVRDRLNSNWVKRYFKRGTGDILEVFSCGGTSRTGTGLPEEWLHCKLDPEASSLLYWIPNTGTEPRIADNEVCLVKFNSGSIIPYEEGLDWSLINNITFYAIIKP